MFRFHPSRVTVLFGLFSVLGCNAASMQETDPSLHPKDDNTRYEIMPEREYPRTKIADSFIFPNTPDEEYATDVYLNSGCDINPAIAAVATQHQTEALCEHVIGMAIDGSDGDTVEIGRPFSWQTSDATVITVACKNGPSDNYCKPIGMYDVIDGDGVNEPCAVITACALNDCSDPPPLDCMDEVCRSVTVCSIVNIEGVWSLQDVMNDAQNIIHLLQDGRRFQENVTGVKHGYISGTSIYFEIGDYTYQGTISENRNHIQGAVHDSIFDMFVGTWSADRVVN